MVEYRLPQPDTWAQWLAADGEGNIWYAGFNSNSIGRISLNAPYMVLEPEAREISL
jgi:streptogramin lyase